MPTRPAYQGTARITSSARRRAFAVWGWLAVGAGVLFSLAPGGLPAADVPGEAASAHWAFQAPRSADLPAEATGTLPPEWQANLIDRLVGARHRELGLIAQPEAPPETWLRRVHFDLVGLPPTPAERAAFLADPSPAARERVVEDLLASPHYGERWGRHFMDIWRYSDWWGLGDQLRYSQKHLWRWRDWIVESLNADMGYDRLIVEMLAGDELAPDDPDVVRATGFLCRPYYLFNRTTWLDQAIEHTSRGFLGLTMQCVKCHDHKYDPISHADYYRMRAVFEPYHVRVDAVPGETDLERDGLPRAFDLHLDRPTHLHLRGDEKEPDESLAITPGPPAILGGFEVSPISLPAPVHSPHLRPHVLDDHLRRAEAEIDTARKAVETALAKVAEAKQSAAAPTDTTPPRQAATASPQGPPIEPVTDDFSGPRPDLWRIVDGEWRHEDGRLRQSAAIDGPARIRSLVPHPADFEARIAFTILDGMTWKSVGFCFDLADNGDNLLAYVSAHGEGKAQVAVGRGDRYDYPADALRAHPVSTGRPIEMVVRARGQLINVEIDGDPVLAWRSPAPRSPGRFQLLTYDARAEFTGLSVIPLPAEATMVEAGPEPASDVSPLVLAEAGLAAARAELAAAERNPAFLRASWEADRAKAEHSGTCADLIVAAAAAEAEWKAARAEAVLRRAEAAAREAPADQRAEAEKKAAEAAEALAKAKTRLESPGDSYESLTASIKALEGPDESEDHRALPYPHTSTGRRLALARWIADRSNPLTARVLVNHVWTRRFSASFVPDVSDFGLRCPPPALQPVLDSLAVEFMEQGWSLKHLHRLMVHSRVYRTSSSNAGADPATLAADPDNANLWRMNPKRLESQAIRDAMLTAAGLLDRAIGGPPIDPAQDEDSFRRSLYFRQTGELEHRFLGAFDNVSVVECYRRRESVTPQQALALANARLTTTCAATLAASLTRDAPDSNDQSFIRSAWVAVLGREPRPAEIEACVGTLAELEAARAGDEGGTGAPDRLRARTLLVQAMMNHNDFVTVR